MDLSSFKLDIDELIYEFSEGNSTTLSDMKRIWMSRKFSFIYEARPTTNVAFFMQALYAHSIGHMLSADSLSQRLGGLYCLYCLYETQPFKPPFRIYLSLGELRKLKHLVIEAKNEDIKVLPALVGKMLEKNMFLFGFVDINEGSVTERVNEITNLQIGRTQLACEKLLADTPIERCLHMDLGMELDQKVLKKMSTEYAKAKELAIMEAGKVVDIENIKHIAENKILIGDAVEKITEDWNVQKEEFYEQIGFNRRPLQGEKQVTFYQQTGINQCNVVNDDDDGEEEEEEQDSEDFTSQLEHLLS